MKTILEFVRKDAVRAPFIEVERTRIAERCGFSLRTAPHDISPADAAQLIRFWSPAGCLVNNDRMPAELYASIPTVFFHRKMDRIPPHSVLVRFDEQAIAETAARELLSLDLKTYAFVPSPSREHWCETREQHFNHIISLNGFASNVFTPSKQAASKQSRYQSELSKWINALPRPAGVFAANDHTAQNVLNVCSLLNVKVPDELVVVGVDNIEPVCECTSPSISSIDFDWLDYTRKMLQTLKQLIDGKSGVSPQLLIPPKGVVRRASSIRSKRIDHCVIAALDVIRRKSCDKLSAADVAALFPCSRRMAEIRFRATTGKSILEVIRETRRQKAQELIALKGLPRDTIIAACGYTSWNSIRRLVRIGEPSPKNHRR